MKIAFLHYHLKRGGVTSVIRHQAEALASMGWPALVVSGAPSDSPFPAHVATIPELGYDNTLDNVSNSPDILANKIINVLHRHWPQGPDIVHVHNPTLGKNKSLQGALKILQQTGMPLLCQIHDFAEDGRPALFQNTGAYVGNCHYAAINPRDHRLLIQSGLKIEGCHLLANTVQPVYGVQHPNPSKNMVIYPVRAIRRKNIGEALLISLFLPRGMSLAISLPPNSPVDCNSYDRWRNFSYQHGLSVEFEIGVNLDYADLMAQGRYVLSTSITEGFGFVYLEPWIHGRALWGRLLPDICQGFMDQGIQLGHLYSRLDVPLNWIDLQRFERKWRDTLAGVSVRLCRPREPGQVESAWRHISSTGNIDFGLLDERAQREVMQKVILDPSYAERLKELNPFLKRPGPPQHFESVINSNAKSITQSYFPEQYARRLKDVYTAVVHMKVEHSIRSSILASAFLNPADFSLLKWGAL